QLVDINMFVAIPPIDLVTYFYKSLKMSNL
ncbi:MAG: hypothetical protein ACI920_003402, partial [Saprospiraceae bacterium]